ncbi:MAG: hypothetical protein NUV67_04825 [archaeon]|nr:hypothetical protein [archaeon]
MGLVLAFGLVYIFFISPSNGGASGSDLLYAQIRETNQKYVVAVNELNVLRNNSRLSSSEDLCANVSLYESLNLKTLEVLNLAQSKNQKVSEYIEKYPESAQDKRIQNWFTDDSGIAQTANLSMSGLAEVKEICGVSA